MIRFNTTTKLKQKQHRSLELAKDNQAGHVNMIEIIQSLYRFIEKKDKLDGRDFVNSGKTFRPIVEGLENIPDFHKYK